MNAKECQIMKTSVIRATKKQTEIGEALIEQETMEENELWR